MTDTYKAYNSNQTLLKNKNRSLSNKNDIFEQFEDNRKILKNNKEQNKIAFKTLNKSNNNISYQDQFDQYGEDFQDVQHNASKITNKNKNKQMENSNKIKNKTQKNYQSLKPQQLKITKQKSNQEHKKAKSILEQNGQKNCNPGRYESEIDKRFNNQDIQSMSNDMVNKNNELIRQYIKKYNDTLTDMINRNLAQLTSLKRKKPASIEQSIKVLQQQIKNNNKIQQLDLTQLQKLTDLKEKLEEQENFNQNNYQKQAAELNNKIKEKKKIIYNMKLAVQNQAKKLMPTNFAASKHDGQSQITMVKEKLAVIRKQFEKNEEKLTSLNQRQYQLTNKLQELGDIDKQADNLRSSNKSAQGKSKRFQQTKKKYDNLKAHVTKVEGLWNTKSNMISYQNQALKQKIKNIELQVKDMQASVKLTYEKSMKTLNTNKPRNQQNQKVLDRIMGQMANYNEYSITKQMSLSQMRLLTRKKPSTDQQSINVDNSKVKQANKQLKINKQQQNKTKSQQSQRNRVWKLQQKQEVQQNKIKNTQPLRLQKSKTQKNGKKVEQRVENKKVQVQKTQMEQKQKQITKQTKKQQKQISKVQKQGEPQTKIQSKPKKFNFNRNKANNEPETQAANQNKPQQQKKITTINHDNPSKQPNLPTKQTHTIQQKPKTKPQPQPQKEQTQTITPSQQNNIQIKPKRFNINLKDRKTKQQGSYIPSIETKQQNNDKKQQKINNNIPETNNQTSNKPVFNLKKKKDSERKLQSGLDNQFMGQ